jgi:hypothetical protein
MPRVILLLVLMLMTQCSGYQVLNRDNPLAEYGISTIAIPMFVNHSSLKGVNRYLTTEMIRVLSSYHGLKVVVGEAPLADAVLVGIVTNSGHRNFDFTIGGKQLPSSAVQQSRGNRRDVHFPTSISYRASLDLYLVKRPTERDLKLLSSPYAKFALKNPKIIFHQGFGLSGSYSPVLSESSTLDSAGVLNFTKTDQIFINSMQGMAVSTAEHFRQVVLNAF